MITNTTTKPDAQAHRLASLRERYRAMTADSGIGPQILDGPSYLAGCRWVEHAAQYFRFRAYADDVLSLRHRGWYMNEDCGDTARGCVYQLPTRNGVEQYVPAVADPFNDGSALLDFSDVRHTVEDAARAGDRLAELHAEDERNYQAQCQREQDLADALERVQQLRREHSESLRTAAAALRFALAQGHVHLVAPLAEAAATLRRLMRSEAAQVLNDVRNLRT